MRWLEVLLPLRLTFYLGSTSSVLLSLFLIQSCDISTTVTTLSDSRLTSRVRWTRGTSGEEEKKEEDVSVSGSLLQASFCLDSVGVKRGLFTRWIDSHGCECSCNPTGKVAVIICGESCSGAPTGLDRGKSEYPLERPETNLGHDNQKFCDFAINGLRYLSGQVWMSPDSPCIQCRCINGEVDCSSSALHCRSVCLPNQETIYTGPCCEQKCITKENASPDVPAVTIKMPDSCVGLNDQATYHHGEIQIRQEECVDQRCQCINGDWFCLDFCTPLENLTCPREERIYWDKFCCPRCQGQKSCSISVQSSHWKDLPPEGNAKKLFVSLTDREPKDSKVRGLRLGQGVRRKTSAQLATVHLQPSGQQTLSEEAEESLEGIHLVQVEPGQHVAHTEGRCVCIDGEFRCSRSGPGMWHDTDCYYADGESGDYYALGAKWTAHNDACIQCRCLAGRLYACSRTPCHSLFLCPVGQTAVATNGECCPTFCMDIDENRNRTQLPDTASRSGFPSHSVGLSKDKIIDRVEDILRSPNFKGHCKPLGYPHSDDMLGTYLPVKSSVVIRRPCIDLQCICQPSGEWICADYCTPCSAGETTAPNQNNHTILELRADGCCLPCASTESKLPWSSNNNSSTSHLTAALERYIRTVTICLILLICIPCVAMCVCCLCPLSKLRVMCAPPKFLSKRRIYQDSGLNTPAISRTVNAAVLVASTDLEPITDNLARSQDDGSKWLSSESDGKLASYINGFEGPQPKVKETEHPTVSLTCPSKHASQLTLTASSATSERELRFEKSVHKAEVDPGRADQLAEHQNHAKNEDTRTLLAFASPNRPHRSASTQSRPARPSTSPGGAARETGLRSVQHYFVHLPSVRQRANTMKQQKRFPGADTSCVHTPKVLHASCELPELSPTPPPKPPLPNFHPIDKKNDGGSVFSVKPSHIDFSAMACSLNELTPYCTGV